MAVDYFLKIEGIDGESPDHKHKNEIQLESWQWGATQPGTSSMGGGMGGGKVQMQDFHFTMKVCKASPKLMQHCATGKHIPSATLTCRKAGGEQQEYLTWKFSDLMISSYQTGGAANDAGIPIDQIAFNFTKIEVDYKEQKSDGSLGGSVKAGYDLKLQKAVTA